MLVRKFLSLTSISRPKFFSSLASEKLEDWQYAHQIQQHLKIGEINPALSYLIKSYLNNTVLDMQTYRNFYKEIEEQNFDITYHEMLYKLYREHFKPHTLMTQCMKTLTDSEDQKTQKLLKKDYEYLGLIMPIKIKRQIKQQVLKESEEKMEEKIQELEEKYFPKSIKNQISENETETSQKHKIEPKEIKQVLETLLGKYSKVVLHDVQVDYEYENTEQDSENREIRDINQDNEGQKDQEFDQKIPITTIRIGMIQITSKDKDNTNNPN